MQIFEISVWDFLALILVQTVLVESLSKLSYQLPLLYHYLDDIIYFPHQNIEDKVLSILNSYHNMLQFIVERENNRSEPFIDTKVIRLDNNIIITDWYQKPTYSGR